LQRCRLVCPGAELRTLEVPLSLDKNLQELHFGAWEGQSAAALDANR
jgi:alpha-ribazole phosphatase